MHRMAYITTTSLRCDGPCTLTITNDVLTFDTSIVIGQRKGEAGYSDESCDANTKHDVRPLILAENDHGFDHTTNDIDFKRRGETTEGFEKGLTFCNK